MNRLRYILSMMVPLMMGVAATTHAQTIRGKIYGGGQLATVDGDTKVQINSGTIGDGESFNGGVFGGGLGEPTVVTGNVKVLIGRRNSAVDAAGPTINGDVYGGSALGNINCSQALVATANATDSVMLNAGTVNGSMYGGALGQKNGIAGATRDIAANVYGTVQVDVNGGIVLRRDGDTGGSYSGGIYGCNNLNGSPQTGVNVDIYHHNSAHGEDKYALFAVYGGGNQANYVGGTPNVTVHFCDNNIEYVYGGGNAAHLTHETDDGNGNMVGDGNTNVTIWGCDSIGNVFGGGNGQVQAANVSGNTSVTIHGGKILNVFGGSNTNGMIGGATNVYVLAQGDGSDACSMDITNVYGGGNRAAGKSGIVNIACTGAGTIDNVYGGANEADLTGDITLNITGGKIKNVFGGNNNSGRINGAITVNVNWDTDACAANSLTNVYGGGNLAPYYAYGYDVVDGVWTERTPNPDITGPTVKLINGTVDENVYGAGKGAPAVVTGNPLVVLQGATVKHDIYGGGDEANVIGTSGVKVETGSVADVYGGGNAADVTNTDVLISDGTINRVFGGGHGNKGTGDDDPNRAAANVKADAHVKVEGGTIQQVFAAGNSLGAIDGHATLEIEKKQLGDDATPEQIAALPKLKVEEAYGGGNEADGNAGTVIVGCTGGEDEYVKDVYGGARAAIVTSDIALTIKGGNINRVFGGNNVSGNVEGAIEVNIDEEEGSCGLSLNNVYGGGNQAGYDPTEDTDSITVNIKNGTVKENVYGGGLGESAVVKSNPAVNLIGGDVLGYAFGGGEEAPVEGNPAVTLMGSTIGTWDGEGNLTSGGDVFAGGNLAKVTGNPMVTVTEGKANDIFAGGKGAPAVVTGNTLAYVNLTDGKELTIRDIYGGGDAANVEGTAEAKVDKGTVRNVYGGGNAADVSSTDVIINGGNIADVYGGGHGDKNADPQTEANISGNVHVTVHGGTIERVFAGSNSKGGIQGTSVVDIDKNSEALAEMHIGEVYGGGNLAAGNAGTINVGCTGGDGESIGDVYGGANQADITSDITLNIQGGTIDRVFGGNNASGTITGAILVNINENNELACTKPMNINNVYGAGNLADYTGSPEVNIQNGTINYDVFGGGLQAKVTGSTTVNVSGGTVMRDVYGGGALADVTGNTNVNLTGGSVGGAYGGGLGQLAAAAVGTEGMPGYEPAKEDVAAIVGGNTTVILNGSQVTGDGIFGANNVNGTPKGHVFVDVKKTTAKGTPGEEYHVPAVYGGGNKAAYDPTLNTDFAEVLIENCDNSIEYVYGGGNAAPVPATQVTIYGADSINHAFAGGNGHGAGNPGADVGYMGFHSTGNDTPYGSGKATITVYGGTVHNVYGGSNTLGYIRTNSSVTVAEAKDDDPFNKNCPLNVDHVYGGGNEADIDGDVVINCECTQGAKIIYAGANNADVNGNVTLNIFSGTYEQVFGGNNTGGCLRGNIEVNIDETGCWPIMIHELYGCGNNAAYSVYGYDNDKHCIENETDMADPAEKYRDPVVNIYSCTRINNVYGGGKGETATVYGNTHVNINTIKGEFAGTDTIPPYVLNDDGEFTPNENHIEIEDHVGIIGNIYGGGNAAAVHGDTEVIIGTMKENAHIDPLYSDKDNHEVNIRIEGDVYGGSKGVLGKPDAAFVTGNTQVIVGAD